ncbi:MAG: hypothetical protein ACRC1J_12415, partial [Sandaracinobacteroides sp.]
MHSDPMARPMPRSALLAALASFAFALGGCSTDGSSAGASPGSEAPARADPQALKTSGEARRCIPNRSSVSTTPAGESVLMFRSGTNSWFRNDLRSRCPSMRADRTL